jgi:DNA polymerase-3 subunit gamma/tau
VSFAKNIFTIGFGPEVEDHIGLVDNARNHTLLQTKFQELGHPNVQLKFIKAEPPAEYPIASEPSAPNPAPEASGKASPALPAPAAPVTKKAATTSSPKEDFKNDPLILKALEIFKGQIIEVRA